MMVRIGVEGLALKSFQWKCSGKPKVVRRETVSEMGQMRKKFKQDFTVINLKASRKVSWYQL